MKGHLVSILLGALLIVTMIVPAEEETRDEPRDTLSYSVYVDEGPTLNQALVLDQLDQQSSEKDGAEKIGGSLPKDGLAQSFKPTLPTLTKVILCLKSTGSAEFYNYYVYIKQTLTGSVLTSASIPRSSIIVGTGYYTFDFSDISVTPGSTYYIVVRGVSSSGDSSSVYWWYGYPDPYPNGNAFEEYIDGSWSYFKYSGNNCDFCFQSYGIPSGTNNPPNTPSPLSGPSSGTVGSKLSYTTSATDPDTDYIYYGLDFNGDSTSDAWTDYSYPSGAPVTIHITFYITGTYYIRVQAKDIHGALSGFSSAKTVTIGGSSNTAPNTPSTPIGPITGTIGVSSSYETSTTDPDGDEVRYGWDWNGDDIVDEWSGLQSSGTSCSLSHAWSTAGTYQVKVKAEDEYGAESSWSPTLTVTISAANNPPEKPSKPTGQTKGKPGTSYSYTTSTTDLDGDNVYYWFDWGDGTNSGWVGPYSQGSSISETHSWTTQGTFPVKVKAKDVHDEESVWSDSLSVSMPKQKSVYALMNRILRHYPIVLEFLRDYMMCF